ncbi:Oidioi.mRNA.OKI2018_I69.chr2.g6219.t1.cds [Oikopleura dioica]|uniref:Oidioi.mRNA.OKI2018_I69.chr2.g6219.t1.cds n=1 Tax=Oikopleura dioica TaxID=34765 RepID=A0ABN7T385_OIKDI|nr:Oidioi.mRNA.OKI2018_I69.chr2.g6219.t1.cds [Oikopleura dioica]
MNKCGYCGKGFKDPFSLNDEWRMVEHLMRCGGKHDKRGVRKTECLACGNETEFEKSVKNHALLHVLPNATEDKPLACPIPVPCCLNQCGRVFYDRTSLYQHVLGSFNKRQCAAHQREECLNRLLDQTPAALTFPDQDNSPREEETQIVPKISPVPEETPLTASQFLQSAQFPASSQSKSAPATPVKIRRPNILRRKPKPPKKQDVKVELLESA